MERARRGGSRTLHGVEFGSSEGSMSQVGLELSIVVESTISPKTSPGVGRGAWIEQSLKWRFYYITPET